MTNSRRAGGCSDVEVLVGDAASFRIPDDVTVVYLYNPFGGQTFEKVIGNILASVERSPRRLRLVYRTPLEHDALMQTGRFTLVRSIRGLRPTRRLAESASLRVYEVQP